ENTQVRRADENDDMRERKLKAEKQQIDGKSLQFGIRKLCQAKHDSCEEQKESRRHADRRARVKEAEAAARVLIWGIAKNTQARGSWTRTPATQNPRRTQNSGIRAAST